MQNALVRWVDAMTKKEIPARCKANAATLAATAEGVRAQEGAFRRVHDGLSVALASLDDAYSADAVDSLPAMLASIHSLINRVEELRRECKSEANAAVGACTPAGQRRPRSAAAGGSRSSPRRSPSPYDILREGSEQSSLFSSPPPRRRAAGAATGPGFASPPARLQPSPPPSAPNGARSRPGTARSPPPPFGSTAGTQLNASSYLDGRSARGSPTGGPRSGLGSPPNTSGHATLVAPLKQQSSLPAEKQLLQSSQQLRGSHLVEEPSHRGFGGFGLGSPEASQLDGPWHAEREHRRLTKQQQRGAPALPALPDGGGVEFETRTKLTRALPLNIGAFDQLMDPVVDAEVGKKAASRRRPTLEEHARARNDTLLTRPLTVSSLSGKGHIHMQSVSPSAVNPRVFPVTATASATLHFSPQWRSAQLDGLLRRDYGLVSRLADHLDKESALLTGYTADLLLCLGRRLQDTERLYLATDALLRQRRADAHAITECVAPRAFVRPSALPTDCTSLAKLGSWSCVSCASDDFLPNLQAPRAVQRAGVQGRRA